MEDKISYGPAPWHFVIEQSDALSEELKMKAIRAVLDQKESLISATARFDISDRALLAKWIERLLVT